MSVMAENGELLFKLAENTSGKEPFSISEPEHDMSTFTGRFKNYVKLSNLKNAFFSDEKITHFQKILDE